jgi:hypothetical protein
MAQGEGGGRPTKLTKEFLEKFKELLDNPAFVLFTDEEICDYMDIDKQTKINWLKTEEKTEEKQMFFDLIKKARAKQKLNLGSIMQLGENGWQAKAWILERKFGDLNLRNISEVKNTNLNMNADVTIDDLIAKMNTED